nr:hypothetical protein [Tanacetum cinerariifolium]
MRDLDPVPLGPNLLLPLKGAISKPMRSTRSSSSKPVVSIGLKNFRNMSNRMGKLIRRNVNDARGSMDEVMNEVPIGKKHVSFVNVVQGLSKSGNNKLKLIHECMNDQGKRIVDMDPLVEKGSMQSCGGSISEKEAQADLGEHIMGNLYVNAGKGNNISQGVNANVSMSVNVEIGLTPVPVSENTLDPDLVPLGPNLLLPLKGAISKPMRSTRSSSSKPIVSIGLKNFRNMSNRMGKLIRR